MNWVFSRLKCRWLRSDSLEWRQRSGEAARRERTRACGPVTSHEATGAATRYTPKGSPPRSAALRTAASIPEPRAFTPLRHRSGTIGGRCSRTSRRSVVFPERAGRHDRPAARLRSDCSSCGTRGAREFTGSLSSRRRNLARGLVQQDQRPRWPRDSGAANRSGASSGPAGREGFIEPRLGRYRQGVRGPTGWVSTKVREERSFPSDPEVAPSSRGAAGLRTPAVLRAPEHHPSRLAVDGRLVLVHRK